MPLVTRCHAVNKASVREARAIKAQVVTDLLRGACRGDAMQCAKMEAVRRVIQSTCSEKGSAGGVSLAYDLALDADGIAVCQFSVAGSNMGSKAYRETQENNPLF